MKVLRASAGSGKTYRLSKIYIKLLLDSPDRYAYRHILAVTFTNKATSEMKGRILKDLAALSDENPKAKTILIDILHDYSAFAISTIDKFFQHALKSFSKEIGQVADYQIELDKKSLITETMDRILDTLDENQKELLDWIKGSLSESLASGESLNMDRTLYDMGEMLLSDEHRRIAGMYGIDDTAACSKTRLDAVRRECRGIIRDFIRKAGELGIAPVSGFEIKKPAKTALKKSADLYELFGRPYCIYQTALTVDRLIFRLGLAGEFYRGYDALLKEKNVMCLDESNSILKDIIDGSDAPFVYEKLGVRYENFLLDEFQDTSLVQWNNFLPLLRESESYSDGSNLIVGDVKQSIYRWRESDWHLLAEEVPNAFPAADYETMEDNWRSCREIVDFNNKLFSWLSSRLGLDSIYGDVHQNVKSKDPQRGFVKVTFTDDQQEAICNSVIKAREKGARWGDIAVLVRAKAEGAKVAECLLQSGFPVISDDSLNIKSSRTVRNLVAILSGLENPEDRIQGFMAASLQVQYPSCYHSLVDLCEALLRSLMSSDPSSFEGETLFVQAFMDELRSWCEVNGNNLRYFLKHFQEKDLVIGSPQSSSAIRIMTIHKSKGLQFPYVIVPFVEKIAFYKHDVHWCRLNVDGTPFSREVEGIYPLDLTGSVDESLFRDSLASERSMQKVDNMNVFYVALTRAEKSLHVIAGNPPESFKKSLSGTNPEYKNFSQTLYHYLGCMDEVQRGEEYDFDSMEREAPSQEMDFETEFSSYPLEGRLTPSRDAMDFFSESGQTGVEASNRLRGVVLHDILSKVEKPGDLALSVHDAVRDGRLTPDLGEQSLDILSKRVGSHPEWFDGPCNNERAVFDSYGNEYRPDRVVLAGDETVILDFKFGREEDKYISQVSKYMKLYRELGYPGVKGYIWYVLEDKCVNVNLS